MDRGYDFSKDPIDDIFFVNNDLRHTVPCPLRSHGCFTQRLVHRTRAVINAPRGDNYCFARWRNKETFFGATEVKYKFSISLLLHR